MCVGLAAAGDIVTLVASGAPINPVEGVNLSPLPHVKNRFLRILLVAPLAMIKAARIGADIIHIHDAELLPWARLLAWRGHKVVFDMHEYLPAAIETKQWIPKWARPRIANLWSVMERWLLRGIPVIFAEESYAKHYPSVEESKVVLNLPDAKRLLSAPEPNLLSDRIAYVGGVTRGRGSVVTLQALGVLQGRGHDVEYLCIGPVSAAHRHELEKLVEELELKGVRFVGFTPQPEALKLIREATIGLAVLQPEKNYKESYPTKMFEYMALGLPVVVSDFPLYEGVVSSCNCGLCVDPESPIAIADAVEYLLRNRQEAIGMGRNGREAVRRVFNWESELRGLRTYYQSLAPRSKSSQP